MLSFRTCSLQERLTQLWHTRRERVGVGSEVVGNGGKSLAAWSVWTAIPTTVRRVLQMFSSTREEMRARPRRVLAGERAVFEKLSERSVARSSCSSSQYNTE
jgi:hypothetical protein